MKIFIFDYATRMYTGSRDLTVNDIDPRQPDTFIIPGDSTLEAPPRHSKGLWPVRIDGAWQIYEIIDVPDPYEDFDQSG